MSGDQKKPDKILILGDKFVIEAELAFPMTPKLEQEAADMMETLRNSGATKFADLLAIAEMDPKKLPGTGWDDVEFMDEGDVFEGSNLRNTSFRNTKWNDGTSLDRALLEGSDLRGATGLSEEKLARAYINEGTILPENIDRAKIMELHRALQLPEPPPYNTMEGAITFSVPATMHLKS